MSFNFEFNSLPSFVQYAYDAFKSIYKDLRFALINPDENFQQSSSLPRKPLGPEQWRGLSRYSQPNRTKGEEILSCSQMTVSYRCDKSGPIFTQDQASLDPLLSPKWRLDVLCGSTTINYGPWVNMQRYLS